MLSIHQRESSATVVPAWKTSASGANRAARAAAVTCRSRDASAAARVRPVGAADLAIRLVPRRHPNAAGLVEVRIGPPIGGFRNGPERAETPWRRWTGIEPAGRGSPVPTALKAAEPTRCPDTSLGCPVLAPDEVVGRLVGDLALARRAPRAILDGRPARGVAARRALALAVGAPVGE